MSRSFLEARSLPLGFELEESEILVSSVEFRLGHRWAAFLRDDSRLELRFDRGPKSNLVSRFDLVPRSDLTLDARS
ncbi:hypothetical protein F2Q70_00004140 [Brassica cretica]|uniref:Uncharacterized protein n=1 Tax=Brassica cretica TaxID=69181 RepID=A0A8S9IV49_BRACR|nr:hypothetical protein F2Q70_00004140 [Brassica cretica]